MPIIYLVVEDTENKTIVIEAFSSERQANIFVRAQNKDKQTHRIIEVPYNK